MSTKDNVTDNDDLKQDEMAALKARADQLNLAYHPSIGLDKLREKVKEALSDEPVAKSEKEVKVVASEPEEETKNQRISRLRKEATALVRIRVSCMNPAKKEWDGEIFTVGNSTIGTIKKYVPFNSEEGWHVPHVIYLMLRDRQCQIFVNSKSAHGVTTRQSKLIKEFAIEILAPLTKEELADLAQRQAIAKTVD